MPVQRHTLREGFWPAADFASDACVRHYKGEGWIVLQGFYDVEREILPVHRELNGLIRLKLDQLGLSVTCPGDQQLIHVDDFLAICREDRQKAGEIYRATRHLTALQKLLVKEDSLALACRFMNTRLLNIIPYVPIRIDIRGEEKYLFDWHQDYPYIQGSMDGIVLWSSLFDLNEGEGGVRIIPRSHKAGLRPVILCDSLNERKNGAHTIAIDDAEAFEKEHSISIRLNAGDVLVFSTLLVHKSVPMERGNVRWTTQFRYTNFEHLDAVRRGWPGGMIEGNAFEKDHPDFVIPEHQTT